MIRKYSQMHRIDNYSQHCSIIRLVWLNGSVFVSELSGCGFESSCSHLNFRSGVCLEQGGPRRWGNYRLCIHSETRTWHDKNIQSNAPCRYALKTQLNHLAGWAKCFRVRLWIKRCMFESSCSHLNFRFRSCFEQGVFWHWGIYGVWIHP